MLSKQHVLITLLVAPEELEKLRKTAVFIKLP
jgi:hypothetical protein